MRTHWVVDAQTQHAEAVPFTAEEEAAADAADVQAAAPSNFVLTDQQLRIGLSEAGFPPDRVQAEIAAIVDVTERTRMQIWWDRALSIEWGQPMWTRLWVLLGMNEKQAVAMWHAAKDVSV